MTYGRTVGLLLLSVGLAGVARGSYPTPAQAGFHHCALIYDTDRRGPDELAPYVARADGGTPREWLFDSFLFLIQSTPGGGRPMEGGTRLADWQYHLDRWFAPGRDLAALDQAVERAAQKLGPPPRPRQVMLSIPFPDPEVTDFGDVDGDGASEDLSTPGGRGRVADWYVGEAIRRFEAGGYRHLELWGCYWMREGIYPAEEPVAKEVAARVHAAGYRIFWIPWYRAPGWDRWREVDFDLAILQPNYAFVSEHGGRIRRNRLSSCAELAREQGLGIEIELPMAFDDPAAPRLFRHYLADGALDRFGYQAAATAYYLGASNVELLAGSADPVRRGLYEAMADYVADRTVPDPDPPLTWTVDGRPRPGLGGPGSEPTPPFEVAEATLDRPHDLVRLDLFLLEPGPAETWHGTVEVDLRPAAGGEWRPAGWAMRDGWDGSTGRWQVVTVPVRGTASAVRVRVRSDDGSPPLRVCGLEPELDTRDPAMDHLAVGRPYRFTPAPEAHYGDRGGELTDGVVPDNGFPSGDTIGWYGRPVTVALDLGRVVPIDSIEVHCQGGSYAAVNWPVGALALLAEDAPPPAEMAGTGPLPTGLTTLPSGPLTIDRRRSETDQDGHLTFQPPAPCRARYVTLLFSPHGWLMLSEVRLLSGGRNVVAGRPYQLDPPPTAAEAERYPDDGHKLTDGVVARALNARRLVGWTGDAPREAVIDLGRPQPVHTVTVWCLRARPAAVFDPGKVEVAVSGDGQQWSSLEPKLAEDLGDAETGALGYRAEADGGEVRWVRVRVTHEQAWAMLSEVEVK